jgi:hypothetical protein
MPTHRTPGPTPGPRVLRPGLEPHPARSKPDSNPIRLLIGLVGIASASAITTALLPSVTPAPVVTADTAIVQPVATPTVVHVTQYVTLKPGETAPPQAAVVVQPTPTPKVTVVTTTRQSGKP